MQQLDRLDRAHRLIEQWPDEVRHPLIANHRADIADLTRLVYLLSLEASGLPAYLAKALRCVVEAVWCMGYAAGRKATND